MFVYYFVFEGYGDHRDLHVLTHSFPTRRSSDLFGGSLKGAATAAQGDEIARRAEGRRSGCARQAGRLCAAAPPWEGNRWAAIRLRRSIWSTKRSEEHTSELQSLMRISYAVFCLKKKKTHNVHRLDRISTQKPEQT